MTERKKIDILTLGCSKNLVDTERLMAQLEQMGFVCTHDPEVPNAPIAIINTCGFIGDAKEESINTILSFVARKRWKRRRGEVMPLERLYVMGCLSQRYLKDLEDAIPEVDGWYGKFDFLNIVEKMRELAKENSEEMFYCNGTPIRHITTPKHYAYLKISEGCNRMCSYCAIPLITGHHVSRKMDELVEEARWLVSQGVKELNVIAQDLSSYGLDTEKRHLLPELIERLAEIEGLRWIRLHYAYPTDFPEELLDVMARHKNVCKYLDIALQHCTDNMLGMMRRHITQAKQDELIRKIRSKVPGICIRTTLMVGHPGETEADFEALKAWTRTMRFERMGAFAYSDEDGTYANKHYEDNIPQEVKQHRLEELMAIQQEIAGEIMQQQVGSWQDVIIDRQEGEYYIGRTEKDSPEVDCEVLVRTKQHLNIGDIYPVHITKAEEFDLYGEI